MERTDLLNLNTEELQELLAEWGEPKYRAGQIERWIYGSLVDDFDGMTDLPHELRKRLKESTRLSAVAPVTEQASADGLTRKVVFRLADGQTLETVLMLYADAPDAPELAEGEDTRYEYKRRTVCISTQVGCPIGCPFCATGQAGYIRNLTAGEIVAQVLYFARERQQAGYADMPLTNIVIMGMGEPLLKFDITWRAIEALTDPARLGLGARRITVSTSGILPGIAQLAQQRSQVNLAVSLHAPDDALRNVLVPINRKYPLIKLLAACRDYVGRTHRRITFEYALMEGINDSPEQARAMIRLLHGLLCHVNLIPLNPTTESPYHRPAYERVKAFERILRDAGIATTLRVEKGIEIAAGCGQLRQQVSRRKA
ncbi:MAG: 23S rRNA (adenine(2503)-C(2))-methyltransferase RlmN [Anaerolineae bacterium]